MAIFTSSEHFELRKDEKIQEGDIIGRIGKTGKLSGPHLHFEYLPPGLVEKIKKNTSTTSLGISHKEKRNNPIYYLDDVYTIKNENDNIATPKSASSSRFFLPNR